MPSLHQNEKGLSIVEVVISAGILLFLMFAALSLWSFYSSSFFKMAKLNDAQILGTQIVSEMKQYSARYPKAMAGGNVVIYRRCYDRSLGIVPDGSDLIRVVTDEATDLCPTPFQVDIKPDAVTPNFYRIEVEFFSTESARWEQSSVYRMAF